MKMLIGLIFWFFSAGQFAEAEVCGLVRVSNHKQEVILEDHQSESSVVRYKVTNPENYDWLAGSCTCVGERSFEPNQDRKGKWDYIFGDSEL